MDSVFCTLIVYRMKFDKIRNSAHGIVAKTVHKTLPEVGRVWGLGGGGIGVWGSGDGWGLGLGVVGSGYRG